MHLNTQQRRSVQYKYQPSFSGDTKPHVKRFSWPTINRFAVTYFAIVSFCLAAFHAECYIAAALYKKLCGQLPSHPLFAALV